VTLKQQNISSSSPTSDLTSFLAAVGESPSAIIGAGDASNIVVPLIPSIAKAGIPVVTLPDAAIEYLGKGTGSKALFPLSPDPTLSIQQWVQYAIDTYHPKKVGYVCVQSDVGDFSCQVGVAYLKSKGIQVVEEYNGPTATDLTQQVLALKGVDVVFTTNYPSPGGVLLNQLADNGINAPVVTVLVGAFIVAAGNPRASTIPNIQGDEQCAGQAPNASDPVAVQFRAAWQAAFGSPAVLYGPDSYSETEFVLKAIKIAASQDPAKVTVAMGEVPQFDSPCGPMVLNKANNSILSSIVVVNYDASTRAVKSILKTIVIP